MSWALFERDGDRFMPTELSRGPWDARHCHGGPVSALLARAIERADGDSDSDSDSDSGGAGAAGSEPSPWQVSRLTIELTRPVPVLRPLTLEVHTERPGRKVSLVTAVLSDVGTEVARVRALRIRDRRIDLPDDANRAVDTSLPGYETGRAERTSWAVSDQVAFHSHGAEHRFVEGSWEAPGPVAVWVRLLHPVVHGEVPSGVQRAAAAADFGNGVSGSLPYERFVYINPDLTVHLARPPVGEWIGMRTASYYGPAGAGLAESALFDTDGRLGRSCQSLFVDPR